MKTLTYKRHDVTGVNELNNNTCTNRLSYRGYHDTKRWCHIDYPRSFTSRTHEIVSYQLPLGFTLGAWLWDIHIHLQIFHNATNVIQQIRMYLRNNVRIHTHIHTDTTCIQHINVGIDRSGLPQLQLMHNNITKTQSESIVGYKKERRKEEEERRDKRKFKENTVH